MRKAIGKSSLFFELGATHFKARKNKSFWNLDTRKWADLEPVFFLAALLLALPMLTALLLLLLELM